MTLVAVLSAAAALLAAAAAFWQAWEARQARTRSEADAVQARLDAMEAKHAADLVGRRVAAPEKLMGDRAPELTRIFSDAMTDGPLAGTADHRLRRAGEEWRLRCIREGAGQTEWAAENRTGAIALNVRAVPSDPGRIVQYPDPDPRVPAGEAFTFIDAPTFGSAGTGVTITWEDDEGNRFESDKRLA